MVKKNEKEKMMKGNDHKAKEKGKQKERMG